MQEDDLDYGDAVFTHAGDLDFEYIFFGILPHSMKNGLKEIDKLITTSEADLTISPVHKCQK